ncbi:MAG: N-acetyltransferase family protein [Halofilum sp. (in: g-proteobacteria)]
MPRIVARLRRAVRNLGWANGCVSVLADLVSRLSRGSCRIVRYRLLVQPIEPASQLAGRRGRDLCIREAGPGDPVLVQMGRPQSTIRERFEQGARCLVALRDGELVAFIWWIEGPYREDEVRCLFIPQPAGAALWDFDIYVAPTHRLGPAFARLWDAAMKQMHESGFEHSCSRISAFNISSLQAHKRLGARVVGTRSFLCIGLLQVTLSRDAPRLHVSWRTESRPIVRVPPDGTNERRKG